MTRILKAQAWLLLNLLVATSGYAVNPSPDPHERNYRVIIDRNPFGLKPPPPPATNAPPPVQARDEIYLTGITAIGSLRAYFMTKAPQGKNPEYYNLGVDEKKNGLEVISIDPGAKSVRIRNAGLESVMTFAANGVKPPATPASQPGAPGAGGGAPPMAGGPPNPMGAVPPGLAPGLSTPTATPAGNSRVRTIPSRNIRTPATQINPVSDPNAQANRPNPDAAVQDLLLMELQKRSSPDIQFPPTPFPQ